MKKITLRLSGGKFNNRIIVSYNPNTKTTASVVRQAVFNMIDLRSGTVLDLFAGSGAYGFEAISRGADKVYFNDIHQLSIKAINENATILNCLNKANITKQDYTKTLDYYKENNINFDYAFIDPPYDMSDNQIKEILSLLSSYHNNLTIIVERKKDSPTIEIEGLSLIKFKNYGTRQIQIYEK